MPMAAPWAMPRAVAALAFAPVRPAAAITSDSASAKHSASWPSSPIMKFGRSCAAAFLPAAAALERIHHFGRHIFLIMLGQHFAGNENARAVHRAQRHHALAFAEQRRQHAVIFHRHGLLAV